jgi:hypothetical protein
MDQQNIIDLPLKVNNMEVRVVPTSPLAQAQNMEDLEKVLQFAQIAAQFGQAGQMTINQEEMLEYIAVKMGVPQSVLTTPAERDQMMQEMMQQQQAMAQQAGGVEQAIQQAIPGA